MPTALELPRASWNAYEPWRRIPTADGPERAAALAAARRAAAVLKSQFGVKRVRLFGSIAHGLGFRPDSDIDLAVEGLDPAAYWPALAAVEGAIGSRTVDLLEIETAPSALQRAVLDRGLEI